MIYIKIIDINDILYDIIIDIILCPHYICLAAAEAAEPPPNQRADASDDDLDSDRPMDFDEESDFADQGPLTDRDMGEDVQNLATVKNISELGVSLFALFALMVHFLHFFQGATNGPRNKFADCWDLFFLLLFLMYGSINEIRNFACLPVLRQ